MSNVIDLDDYRTRDGFVAVAMCCTCMHKWIGFIEVRTSLFNLECPECGVQDSYAAILPSEYVEHFRTLEDPHE